MAYSRDPWKARPTIRPNTPSENDRKSYQTCWLPVGNKDQLSTILISVAQSRVLVPPGFVSVLRLLRTLINQVGPTNCKTSVTGPLTWSDDARLSLSNPSDRRRISFGKLLLGNVVQNPTSSWVFASATSYLSTHAARCQHLTRTEQFSLHRVNHCTALPSLPTSQVRLTDWTRNPTDRLDPQLTSSNPRLHS